jgi:P27 family predicted phage terminase small subunit
MAQFAWVRIRVAVEPLGILTDADAEAFELLCQHYGLALKAAETIGDEGLVLEADDGRQYRHPADLSFLQHSKAFLRYASEFGFTAASRSGLHLRTVASEEEETSLADQLFQSTKAAAKGKVRETTLSRIVGKRASRAMAGAGLGTLELALAAVREGMQLTTIPGVGPATVRKLEASA